MNSTLRLKADVGRLCMSERKMEGRELRQMEATYQNAIVGMEEYIESRPSKAPHLSPSNGKGREKLRK